MKKKKTIIFTVCGVLAILILVTAMLLISNVGVKLDNYIKSDLKYDGNNEYASVSLDPYDVIDLKQMYYDMTGRNIEDDGTIEELKSAYDFENCFKIEMSNAENGHLKNGDNIELKISINKDVANSMSGQKKKLKGDDVIYKTYQVNNLKELDTINMFDAVKNVFVDPDEKLSSNENPVYLEIDEDWNFKIGSDTYSVKASTYSRTASVYKNGEYSLFSIEPVLSSIDNYKVDETIIKVKIKCDEEQCLKYGFKIKDYEKEYSLKTSNQLKTMTQISDYELDYIKLSADKIAEKFMENQDEKNLTFDSIYFGRKQDTTYGSETKIEVFYKAIYNNKNSYIKVSFQNLKLSNDNHIINPTANASCMNISNDLDHYLELQREYQKFTMTKIKYER